MNRSLVVSFFLISSVCLQQICAESVQESLFKLGPKLFNQLSPESPGNLVLSPLGLGLGLGLLEAGASPNLKKVIRREFFSVPESTPESDFHRSLTQVQAQLLRKYQATSPATNQSSLGHLDNANLNLINAVFKDASVELKDAFRTVIGDYGTQLTSINDK